MTTNMWTKDNKPAGNELYELYVASQAEESDPDPHTFVQPVRTAKLALTSLLGINLADFELRPRPDCDDPHHDDHHYDVFWKVSGEVIATLISIDHSLPADMVDEA